MRGKEKICTRCVHKVNCKGQMELYLRWLEKYEKVEGENSPIGLILCADKNEEHVELLQLEKSNIKVAEYLTQLLDMKVLESKFNQAIERAKKRLAEGAEYKVCFQIKLNTIYQMCFPSDAFVKLSLNSFTWT